MKCLKCTKLPKYESEHKYRVALRIKEILWKKSDQLDFFPKNSSLATGVSVSRRAVTRVKNDPISSGNVYLYVVCTAITVWVIELALNSHKH